MPSAEQQALAWVIRKLERLGSLNEQDREGLAALAVRIEQVPNGRYLVREGERPDECCFLVAGYACRHKTTAAGARQIVSFHLRGDILDIQHLLLERADHNVQTISEATIAWFPRQRLVQLVAERPAIGQALWRDALSMRPFSANGC